MKRAGWFAMNRPALLSEAILVPYHLFAVDLDLQHLGLAHGWGGISHRSGDGSSEYFSRLGIRHLDPDPNLDE